MTDNFTDRYPHHIIEASIDGFNEDGRLSLDTVGTGSTPTTITIQEYYYLHMFSGGNVVLVHAFWIISEVDLGGTDKVNLLVISKQSHTSQNIVRTTI